MEIEYERTLDDMVQFNLFHFEHSPTMRRQVLFMQIFLAGFVVLSSFLLVYLFDRDKQLHVASYLVFLLAGVSVFFLYPAFNRAEIAKRTTKLLSEGNNAAVLGPQRLPVSQAGLQVVTAAGDGHVNWSAFEKLAQNDEYIFLYIGAANAIVIPKRAFTDAGTQEKFLTQLTQHISDRGSDAPRTQHTP